MTQISHPYRTQTPTPLCVTCGAPAHLRCPICERPFCIDHASVAPSCADCQRKGAGRGRPVNLAALLGYTAGIGTVSSYLFTINPIAGGLVGALGALGGGIVAAIASRRRSKRGWQVIEGNRLRVSAENGDGQPYHLRALSPRRRRGGAAFQNSLGRFQLG